MPCDSIFLYLSCAVRDSDRVVNCLWFASLILLRRILGELFLCKTSLINKPLTQALCLHYFNMYLQTEMYRQINKRWRYKVCPQAIFVLSLIIMPIWQLFVSFRQNTYCILRLTCKGMNESFVRSLMNPKHIHTFWWECRQRRPAHLLVCLLNPVW